jgi:hypothetical protein
MNYYHLVYPAVACGTHCQTLLLLLGSTFMLQGLQTYLGVSSSHPDPYRYGSLSSLSICLSGFSCLCLSCVIFRSVVSVLLSVAPITCGLLGFSSVSDLYSLFE